MNILFRAGLELQDFFISKKREFCFIGGLAVIRWGEPRMTQDIDISLLSGFGNEKIYIEEILSNFKSRISNPADFAIENRVLLVSALNKIPVDISLSGIAFEKQMIRQASPFQFSEGCSLITCSAEDLIILKAFADRAKDWMDIEGIIMRQGRRLKTDYILRELKPFCEVKDSPEIMRRLEGLLQKYIA